MADAEESYESLKEQIGAHIRRARRAAGLSQQAFAGQMGMSKTVISRYEQGKAAPSSGELLRLARALGYRAEYFLRPDSVSLSPSTHAGAHAAGSERRNPGPEPIDRAVSTGYNGGMITGEESMMATVVSAVYEKGVLRPLSPLQLAEHTRVELQIAVRSEVPHVERERVRAALEAAGILGASPKGDVDQTITDEQLAEAGRALALGGSLSDLIIAEREGR